MAAAASAGGNIPYIGLDLLIVGDEAPLDSRIIDNLSQRLGNDWKKFARVTDILTEADINNIDVDERRVYDKCFKMIKLWEQKSSVKVTVGMTKLNLISLDRNDLLLDIFNTTPPAAPHSTATSSSSGAASSGSRGASAASNVISEPTVSDLQYKHTKKLASFLDPDHGLGIRNWHQLGNAIVQGDKAAAEQIENLHLSYSGGGSAATGFLQGLAMRHPKFTVHQFIEIAKTLRRNDIVSFLEGKRHPPQYQFRNIDFADQERISRLLDKSIRGVADWRMFADSVGFTNDEISSFKLAMKEPNQYSPTHGLLDLLKARYPLLKLTNISKASASIGRKDVAQYLGTVIEEITLAKNPQ